MTEVKRYKIALEQRDMLGWCLIEGTSMSVLPAIPEGTANEGLVCARLVSGRVEVEVIPSATHLPEVCGTGFPMGCLYFQVPKSVLYRVCPELEPTAFQ